MWRLILIISMLITNKSVADHYTSNKLNYMLHLPKNILVINADNYTDFIDSIPTGIINRFEKGSKREILIDSKTTDKLFVVIDVVKISVYKIDVEKTCEKYKKIDGAHLKQCEYLPIAAGKKGMWVLSYSEVGFSYARYYIELHNTTHLYAVMVGRYNNEYQFRKDASAVLKILSSAKSL